MASCVLCNYVFGTSERLSFCPVCHANYRSFCNKVPKGWKMLTGGRTPAFDDWRTEQLIKKQRLNGEISEEEAEQRIAEFKIRLRKTYNPSQEDIGEIRRTLKAHADSQPPTYLNTPSLFD